MRGARFYGFTGDRLLYLWLHKLCFMGRSDMREVAGQIQVGTTVVDVGVMRAEAFEIVKVDEL